MVAQRNADWVKTASAEQIVAAQKEGELATYMGGKTVEEQAQERVVAGTPDRVLEQAYGLGTGQLRGNGDRSSNWFEAIRARMDDEQRAKLDWVEQATPADVFAAQQAGSLKHLTGEDVSDEQARVDAVAAHTHEVMAAALGGA